MTVERDMIIAFMRQMHVRGALDTTDIIAIADEVDEHGSDEHQMAAHHTRMIVIKAAQPAEEPSEEMWVRHRRRQMVLKTQWLAGKRDPTEGSP